MRRQADGAVALATAPAAAALSLFILNVTDGACRLLRDRVPRKFLLKL